MSDFPVAALRSVEITTPDLAGSVDFYTKVWGLEVAGKRTARCISPQPAATSTFSSSPPVQRRRSARSAFAPAQVRICTACSRVRGRPAVR